MTPRADRLPRRRLALPDGLQWRLTGFVAAVLIIATAVGLVVVHRQTGRQLTGQIDQDIRDDVTQLAQTLERSPVSNAADITRTARAYVAAQPYMAVSRLVYVAVGSRPVVTNHPEALAAESVERGETRASQVQEDVTGRRILEAPPGYSVRVLPDAGKLRVYVRRLRLAGLAVTVGAGEPLLTVERAQHSIIAAFLLAGAAILLLALVASYLAGTFVSAPLRDMATVAARIDAGDLEPRMHTRPSQSTEVQVLGDSFNRMLDRLGEAFAGQRAFVADASHELRTPLTVIRGQLEVLAAEPDPSPADVRRVEQLVGVEVARISRLVDDLLLLARSEQTDFLRPETVDVDPFVVDLWDGLSRTADRRFLLDASAHGTIRADPDRLAQALGNLVRNAIAHTRPQTGIIRLEVVADGSELRFTIDDDGPGIPAEERERVFERFHRTDAARTRAAGGTGLGLAIVRAVADGHGGRVCVLPSPLGGARLELTLPGFVPAAVHAPEPRYAAPR